MSTGRASDFGPRLRELREAAEWTQVQLAEKAGLHPQGVVKLERGEREPGWATVIALSAALGVECQAFLEPPSEIPEPRRGRPPKPAPTLLPADELKQTAKRKRGRPKKKRSNAMHYCRHCGSELQDDCTPEVTTCTAHLTHTRQT